MIEHPPLIPAKAGTQAASQMIRTAGSLSGLSLGPGFRRDERTGVYSGFPVSSCFFSRATCWPSTMSTGAARVSARPPLA